jgi:hypothetical protein
LGAGAIIRGSEIARLRSICVSESAELFPFCRRRSSGDLGTVLQGAKPVVFVENDR